MALVLKELNYANSVKVTPTPAEMGVFFSERLIFGYDWYKIQGEPDKTSRVQEIQYPHLF